MRFNSSKIWVLGVLIGFFCCEAPTGVSLHVARQPYERLSEYQFFVGKLSSLDPNIGVLPYDLITPLFSDYAQKARFVWMPKGTSAQIDHPQETFKFPTGTVLIKSFYYPLDERSSNLDRRLLETRLLVRRATHWDALTYVWNEEQTEAYLEIAGGVVPTAWVDAQGNQQTVNYIIPNKNQCKGCHEYDKQLRPIGPRLPYLDKTFIYNDGRYNQINKWQDYGYLSGAEGQEYKKVAAWDDTTALLEDRALAYMEVNCGICHSEHGPASISGLFLTTGYDELTDLGVCKSPVSAGSGSGGRNYDIVPGNPDASIVAYRMESLNPGEMMPELGRTLKHHEGVALIRAWIKSLEGECPESI